MKDATIIVAEDTIFDRNVIEYILLMQLHMPFEQITFANDGCKAYKLIKKNLKKYLDY